VVGFRLPGGRFNPNPPPPPPLRTNRTRRVLHPVLIGHAASSLTRERQVVTLLTSAIVAIFVVEFRDLGVPFLQ